MERNGIKAETWIAAHQPSQKEWVTFHKGIFSRNYTEDLCSCDPETAHVELSRDGLYELLPNRLFFKGNELRGIQKVDFEWTERVLKQRIERIKTVFLPFDTSYFNHSLALERELNGALSEKTALLLQAFVGEDGERQSNPYIRKMTPMTLQAARLRGKFPVLCGIITCILGYPTQCFRKGDRIRFVVNRPGLERKAFLNYLDELAPFFQWVEEWFIPFELRCEFKVRDYSREDRFEGPNKLLLDYNATLGNQPHNNVTDHEQGH